MSDTKTLEKPVWTEEVVEEEDGAKRIPGFGQKPPKDGPCKRCGENKPLNRLFLCYPCWVKVELEKKGWKDGEPHPGGCDCEMTGSHEAQGPRG